MPEVVSRIICGTETNGREFAQNIKNSITLEFMFCLISRLSLDFAVGSGNRNAKS